MALILVFFAGSLTAGLMVFDAPPAGREKSGLAVLGADTRGALFTSVVTLGLRIALLNPVEEPARRNEELSGLNEDWFKP